MKTLIGQCVSKQLTNLNIFSFARNGKVWSQFRNPYIFWVDRRPEDWPEQAKHIVFEIFGNRWGLGFCQNVLVYLATISQKETYTIIVMYTVQMDDSWLVLVDAAASRWCLPNWSTCQRCLCFWFKMTPLVPTAAYADSLTRYFIPSAIAVSKNWAQHVQSYRHWELFSICQLFLFATDDECLTTSCFGRPLGAMFSTSWLRFLFQAVFGIGGFQIPPSLGCLHNPSFSRDTVLRAGREETRPGWLNRACGAYYVRSHVKCPSPFQHVACS